MNSDPNKNGPGEVAESATAEAERLAEFSSRREAILKNILTAHETDDFVPSVCEDFDQIYAKGLYKVPMDEHGNPCFAEYVTFIESLSSEARKIATAENKPGLKTAYKKVNEYHTRQLLKPVIKCQLPKRRAHVQELMKIKDSGDQARVWEKTNELSGGAQITAKMIRSCAKELGIEIAEPALTNSEKFTLAKRLYKPFRELFSGAAAGANRSEDFQKFDKLLRDEESLPEVKSETPPPKEDDKSKKNGPSEQNADEQKDQGTKEGGTSESVPPQGGDKSKAPQVPETTPECNGDQKKGTEVQEGADPDPEAAQVSEEPKDPQVQTHGSESGDKDAAPETAPEASASQDIPDEQVVIPSELGKQTQVDGEGGKTETAPPPEVPTTLAEEEYRRFIPKNPLREYADLKSQQRPFVAHFMNNVYIGFSGRDQYKAFIDAGFPSLTRCGYAFTDTLWHSRMPFGDDDLDITVRDVACAMLEANRKFEAAITLH